ncbi:hypothetical protein CWB41_14115 [Methylovirgula ligni]|uniref:Uncharacterized protein n=1 Tax=Methylovirgula ligni TaxID=569860 RepID=A0A3D9YKX1_9HYPH|nr:hypothetical protein [Methylovirgula ligni]QAY96727.1 hypothetical protein CWB41_14115 [Methylovirgula ligni]REF83230.1 hypothetical protein DES32_3146 [Methylovirgula ligni]
MTAATTKGARASTTLSYPAILARLDGAEKTNERTEKAVKELAVETREQIISVRQDMSSQIGNLSNALTNVADALGKKIDEQLKAAARSQRTDWGVIGIVGGMVLTAIIAVGGLALAPINRDLDRVDMLEREIDRAYVTRDTLAEIVGYGEKRLDRLDDQVDKLRDRAVDRDDEHDYRASVSDQIKGLYGQLDSLRDRVATPGK